MIRKLMSKEEIEKKDHRNKVIMSVVLGVIMLFSTAGYFVMDFSGQKSSTVKYNNIQFKQNEYSLWDFVLNGQAYQTKFNPQDTQNISITILNNLASYSNQPIYFSGEPIEDISGLGMQEILKNIQTIVSRSNYACLSLDCSGNYAIKNCSNDNMIIFKTSSNNQTLITQEDKCVRITYAAGEAERAADAFLFKILQVTN